MKTPLVITAPAEEPITAADLKTHLRIDSNDENDYIDGLITAARIAVENHTHRALVDQTLELWLDDEFPDKGDYAIIIPRPPLYVVTYIKYYDANGALQTVDTDDYQVDTTSVPGRVLPAYASWWPTARDIPNCAVVRYRAGYGDPDASPTVESAGAVPDLLKHAIKLLAADMFENRAPTDASVELPPVVRRLCSPYVVRHVFAY